MVEPAAPGAGLRQIVAGLTCGTCHGHGYVGARNLVPGYYGKDTRSVELGARCPACGGSGVRGDGEAPA